MKKERKEGRKKRRNERRKEERKKRRKVDRKEGREEKECRVSHKLSRMQLHREIEKKVIELSREKGGLS